MKSHKNKKYNSTQITIKEMISSFFIVLLLFIIDRVSKIYAPNKVYNYGISFGLFSTANILPWVILLTIIFLLILFYAYFVYILKISKTKLSNKNKIKQNNLTKFGFLFLFAGSLGNLFDRIFFGFVIDFITPTTYFPSFNLSDVFNFFGVLILIIYLFKKK